MKIILFIALAVMTLGIALCINRFNRISKSRISYGTVVDLPASTDSEGTTTYGVKAEFKVNNDEKYIYKSSWTSSIPGYRIGDKICIYYNPENPNINGLMTFMGAYGDGYFLISIGGLVALTMFCFINSARIIQLIHPELYQNN